MGYFFSPEEDALLAGETGIRWAYSLGGKGQEGKDGGGKMTYKKELRERIMEMYERRNKVVGEKATSFRLQACFSS